MGEVRADPSAGLPEDELLSHLAVADRVIAFVCARNHLTRDEAQDFASHVRVALLDDDRAVLKAFAGRSSLRTYLSVVIQRLYLDYRAAAWGKWRPSAAAVRLGPAGILVERLLTRDRYSVEEAFEAVITNHRVEMQRDAFERLVGCLPPRTRRRFEPDDVLGTVPDAGPSPYDVLEDDARDLSGSHIVGSLQRAIDQCPGAERLLLTLRYQDGMSVAEIAAFTGSDQKKLYRQFDRLLRTLRTRLEASGIGAGDIAALFDASWDRTRAEFTDPRPSMEKGARS